MLLLYEAITAILVQIIVNHCLNLHPLHIKFFPHFCQIYIPHNNNKYSNNQGMINVTPSYGGASGPVEIILFMSFNRLTITISCIPGSVGEMRQKQEERESRTFPAQSSNNCVSWCCTFPFISICFYLGKEYSLSTQGHVKFIFAACCC